MYAVFHTGHGFMVGRGSEIGYNISETIRRGLEESLIEFDDDQTPTRVTYIPQRKKRNFTHPEEQVQAETYIKLVLDYKYSRERIGLLVPITVGSTTAEADIIVYGDASRNSPHIVVECKRPEVSEEEFSQAINQAFSYAVAEGAAYVWVTSGIKDEYYQVEGKRPKRRAHVSDIPGVGVARTKSNYRFAKGGRDRDGNPTYDIAATSENELTRRFKQAHDALWGGGELHPSAAFDELNKLIFCKLWDEKTARKVGEPYQFQVFVEETEEKTNAELKKRIDTLYEKGKSRDPEVFNENIRLSPAKLRTVVSYLDRVNLSETDLDSRGKAFETFTGSLFRGDFGQFFTPRPIVKFIVDVLPIYNTSIVLDTSCGSGGFLLHALDKVRKQAGLDHAEDPRRYYRQWHEFAKRNLFGIEINEQIARVAKMNMIIHDDGHTNVVNADGLLPPEDDPIDGRRGIASLTRNPKFQSGKFDFIITNPPFGSTVRRSEKPYLDMYDFASKVPDWLDLRGAQKAPRPNQSTEILFIERCHKYLKEDRYLAIVLPDGVLTNSTLQYVRDGIEEMFRIVAVISMPQTAFQATGAGVKSSVMFLRKHRKETTDRIIGHRLQLQEKIKGENDYLNKALQIEEDRQSHIGTLRGFDNPESLTGQELTNSENYKEWRKEITATYKEKLDELKESLMEQYLRQKRATLNDYPIFMAIAEDIGYDATGRETNSNELDIIAVELSRFISEIEEGI